MNYRTFGKTGWKVSEIGFGAWQLGGTWGQVDDKESIDTLHYAWEQGINFVDTAALYGAGRSEEVIGRALKQWNGDRIYVATKVPPTIWNQQSDIDAPMRGPYPLPYLRDAVENSLRRLGVECLDLIQMHGWFHRGCYELDWLEALNTLKSEGKIAHIGASLHDARPDQGVELAKLGLVDSIQLVFNLFEQEPLDELFPAAEKSNTAIIARVPFDSGALTGTWTPETLDSWAESDKRRAMYAPEGRFSETLERIERLKQDCAPHYPGLAEAALRYCLHPAAVSLAIPGMRNRAEVDLNVAHCDGNPFPAELARTLRSHAWKHVFY